MILRWDIWRLNGFSATAWVLLTVFSALCVAAAPGADGSSAEIPDDVSHEQVDPVVTESIETEDSGREAEPVLKNPLFARIREIMFLLEKEVPRFRDGDAISPGEREKILRNLVADMGGGIEYASPRRVEEFDRQHREFDARDPKIRSALTISENRILYIRLETFSEEAVRKMRVDCESTARLARGPAGAVVDLRDCASFNVAPVADAVKTLCPADTVSNYLKVLDPESPAISLPIVVFTGPGTAGDAEIFSRILLRSGLAVTMGKKSFGRPFIKKKFLVSNGNFLLIPQIPQLYETLGTGKTAPSIPVENGKEVPYEELAQEREAWEQDSLILRATDLLLSLRALDKNRDPEDR